MTNGIRIQSKNVTIPVNENGDTITLNFDDGNFMNNFFLINDRLERKHEELSVKAEAADKQGAAEQMRAVGELMKGLSDFLAAEIDGVLGKDTCLKVFGTPNPHYTLVIEFIAQLTPYFENYVGKVHEKYSKYSTERMGNV